MPFCIRAVVWITDCLFAKAYLFLCGQGNHLHEEPLTLQSLKGLFCHGSCNCFSSQIKNAFPQLFPHGPHRRKDGRHGFPHARRGLYKQLLLSEYRFID